jgi:hypothetical protein
MMPRKKTEKKRCLKCEKELAPTNFYSGNEIIFPDGKIHICKNCCSQIIDEHGFEGFKMILRIIDKPFLQDVYNDDPKAYIRQVNSLPQYRNTTYDDSDFVGNTVNNSIEINKEKERLLNIDDEVRKRWIGFTSEEDIMFLENFYQELIATYESKTPIQRNLYKNIAETQLLANKAREQGKIKEYQDLLKTMSTLMTDAKVKPLQETGAEDGGLSTWGQWVKKIEETEPIPEAEGEFKDPDGIMKYFQKFFVNHFARVFGLEDRNTIEKDLEDMMKEDGVK